MNKKGDITINYVILFALALIVLIVVALIFYYGTSDFAAKIKETLSSIWSTKPDIKGIIR